MCIRDRPNRDKVAKITKAQVKEIAEQKMPDLNAASIETATVSYTHLDVYKRQA